MLRKYLPFIHPFLFALAPVLFLYAQNLDVVDFEHVLQTLVIVMVITSILLVILNLIFRNAEKAGIICSLSLFLFFLYGHVYGVVQPAKIDSIEIDWSYLQHLVVMGVWISIFVLVIFIIIKKNFDLSKITAFVSTTAGVFVLLSLVQIISHSFSSTTAVETQGGANETVVVQNDKMPDVYYIILDGYARSDVLDEVFEYDNSEFITGLEDMGFYVASKSRSNYPQTYFSLASSLNMEYVNYLSEEVGEESDDRTQIVGLIKKNKVHGLFKELGYKTVIFASSVHGLEFENADLKKRSKKSALNEFENILLQTTAFRFVYEFMLNNSSIFYAEIRRDVINYSFDSLLEIAKDEAATFTFLHVLSPHPPFIFEANGDPVPDPLAFFTDGDHFPGSQEYYIDKYKNQVSYLNQKVLSILAELIESSDQKAIVILQADHGSGSHLYWEDPENTNMKERMSILNAYLLPEGGEKLLYSEITPVNSFRVLLNHYFDASFDVLPDKSYFSTWNHPYDFIDVTGRLDEEEPLSD